MKTHEKINEILRLLRNLIRTGTIAAVNLDSGLCRVDTGNNTTDWLHWLTARASNTRAWNAPLVGEQVLIFSLGGEFDTGFVLPGIFSDDNPAPSASADALHWPFPESVVNEYEPANGALTAIGIQTAAIEAAVKILLCTPEVECSAYLKAKTFEFTEGGEITGGVKHRSGDFSSNGVMLSNHMLGDVRTGRSFWRCSAYLGASTHT